jgi:hypothetical protein
VYDQKKYEVQCVRQEDEEAFMYKNGHFNPQLNERSMAMADSKKMHPIHLRTEEVLYKRNEYLEMRRQQIHDAEVCNECTFCPRLHPKSVGMHGRDRRSLFRWEMKRALKVNSTLERQLQAEAKTCPFAPALTTTSRRMAEDYAATKTVHERLAEDAIRRREAQTQEQAHLRALKPKHFIAMEEEAKPKTPQSARSRPKSAPSGRSPLSPSAGPFSARGQQGNLASRPRSATPTDQGRSRKEHARASAAVMSCSLLTAKLSSFSGSPKAKRGFNYGGGGGDRKQARSFGDTPDETELKFRPMAKTGGKNVVHFNSAFSELVEIVTSHSDGHAH